MTTTVKDWAHEVVDASACVGRTTWHPEIESIVKEERACERRLLAIDSQHLAVGHVGWGKLWSPIKEALNDQSDAVSLGRIFVASDYRRRGVGGALVRAAISAIRTDGGLPVLACEMENSGAFALYHSRGFVVAGRFVNGGRGYYAMVLDRRVK
jgi:ribosomal protein S18 acetylase RimI-like enzyme